MRRCLAVALLVLTIQGLCLAQTNIDSTNMPVPGDTIKRNQVSNLSSINYVITDSNYIWDFSAINGTTSKTDTFLSVLSTPITYIATFSNPFDQPHKATVALLIPSLQSLPGMQITEMYGFYKNSYDFYGQVGFGAKLNGVPIPVKYDHADVLCRFPLQIGNTDTSSSNYSVSIPNLGYNAERKYRINYVDGMGTLYLPGDTFEVVRIKSVCQIFDSLYIDSLGFGFGFNRTETEYKWYSPECHLPVFQVTARQGGGMGGNSTEAWFLDHRDPSAGIRTDAYTSLHLFPVPANEKLCVSGEEINNASYIIYDLSGKIAAKGSVQNQEIPVSMLPKGCYVLQIFSSTPPLRQLFIKE
jgi:hypothetical protein